MRIENDPFPHIIIENYFTEVEYNLVWREIEFLSSKLKGPDKFFAAISDDGEYLTDSSGLSLDSTYYDRSVSDILRIYDEKLFCDEFYESIIDENEYWEYFLRGNRDFTKLRRYTNQQHYQAHQDMGVNVLVSTTLQKEECEGGDLFFPNHAYMIPTKDNQTVIFPGWVKHGVTSVMSNDRYAITKFIHFSMTD